MLKNFSDEKFFAEKSFSAKNFFFETCGGMLFGFFCNFKGNLIPRDFGGAPRFFGGNKKGRKGFTWYSPEGDFSFFLLFREVKVVFLSFGKLAVPFRGGLKGGSFDPFWGIPSAFCRREGGDFPFLFFDFSKI